MSEPQAAVEPEPAESQAQVKPPPPASAGAPAVQAAAFYIERYRGALEAAASLRTARSLVMVATLLGSGAVLAAGFLVPEPLALVVALPSAIVVLLLGVAVGLVLGAGSSTLFVLTDIAVTLVPGLRPGERSDLIVGSEAIDEVEDRFDYSVGEGRKRRLTARQVAWRVAADPTLDHRITGMSGSKPAVQVGAVQRLLDTGA